MSSVDLWFREYGERTAARPPMLLLHGLFGSSANWHTIARQLETEYRVIVPDLRNHGRSPHADAMTYPDMAADVVALLRRLDSDRAILLGHSMGAKVAMWIALRQPAMVERLVAVDMAPVSYPDRFGAVFAALDAVDPNRIGGRSEADRVLAQFLDDSRARQYLLQSLVLRSGRWVWRMNLAALRSALRSLLDYPELASGIQFPGPALFVYGADSPYVTAAEQAAIRQHFPLARLRAVAGAGHWVYADQPQAFLAALWRFLR